MMRLFSRFDLIYLCPSILFFFLGATLLMQRARIKSSKFNFLSEVLGLIQKVTLRVQGSKISKSFALMLCTVFLYLTLSNYLSIFSFVFPLNSQIRIVIGLALRAWFRFILFSTLKNMKGFIRHCVPEGTPLALVCFLFLIELVSQLIRPLTLTVRLVANILAGHLLMILLSKLALHSFFSFLPYLALNAVEMFVAFIQAYILITMLTLYYGESC